MVILKHIELVFNNLLFAIIVGGTMFSPTLLYCQENLVVNPNCEIYDICPTSYSQIEKCLGWWDFDDFGSPDYLNVCSLSNASIPNTLGYQYPLSDLGMIHSIVLTSHYPTNFIFNLPPFGEIQFRESFGGTFAKKLRPVIHYVEFYVNFSNFGSGFSDGRLATNAFDLILLENNNVIFNSVSPHLDNSNIVKVYNKEEVIDDTLNWIKLSACFIPKGGELYFAIGAFRDTNEINLEFSGSSATNHFLASYYFDNFAIYECDTCCLGEFPYEDHVSVASNPGSASSPTTFSVLLNPNTTGILSVYDSAGRLVAKEEFSQLLTTYTLPVLANGVYHYALTTSNGVKDVGKVLVVD